MGADPSRGTDAAFVNAIAHVLITENLVDQEFLDRYCVGYDATTLPASAPPNGSYKAYILGDGPDGIAKTPDWAASITGIPAERIVKLAREIGTAKPVFIAQGLERAAPGERRAGGARHLHVAHPDRQYRPAGDQPRRRPRFGSIPDSRNADAGKQGQGLDPGLPVDRRDHARHGDDGARPTASRARSGCPSRSSSSGTIRGTR